MRRKRWWLSWLLILPLLLLGGFAGYVGWGTLQNQPLPSAEAALASDNLVEVSDDPWLSMRPTGNVPTTGLILYPGGLVPPAAYAPTTRAIAVTGYQVIIVPMPLNLAVTAPNRAAEVIEAYPEIEQWVVGGHSLGGAMAARFAYEEPELVDGLLLWAAYPAGGNDLSDRDLPVVSISGSRDGLATPAEVEASRALLPATTTFVVIEGGNHTQFGAYGTGLQRGDNPATISREEQQAAIVEASVALLDEVGGATAGR